MDDYGAGGGGVLKEVVEISVVLAPRFPPPHRSSTRRRLANCLGCRVQFVSISCPRTQKPGLMRRRSIWNQDVMAR
jgi:hypothetical protein